MSESPFSRLIARYSALGAIAFGAASSHFHAALAYEQAQAAKEQDRMRLEMMTGGPGTPVGAAAEREVERLKKTLGEAGALRQVIERFAWGEQFGQEGNE